MTGFLTLETLKQFRPERDTYFVFGDPIGHSLSPDLHQSYFSLHHLDGDYLAVRVNPFELKEALDCVRCYAKGVNLTIPLKQAVIPLLDEIDPLAEQMGAVNTLQFSDGKIKGYNTDCFGVSAALRQKGVSLKNKSVLILGNGGVCKAFLAAVSAETDNITVAGRNLERVTEFCKGTKAKPMLLSELSGHFDVVLNGTSAGMGEQMSLSALSVSDLKNVDFVFDSIYNPFHTNLITLATALGKDSMNGLYMLIYQGLKAEKIWGNPVSEQDAAEIFSKLRAQFTKRKKNIVLIGYMGSGKTTVGTQLSQKSQMPFYDTDSILEEVLEKKITDVFSEYGEDYFREKEAAMCKTLSRLNGAVIATGGGVIKNPENIRCFKKNGVVVFLNPPLLEIKKRLQNDTTRPLLKDPKKLEQLYCERLESYNKAADYTIDTINAKESAGEILSFYETIE